MVAMPALIQDQVAGKAKYSVSFWLLLRGTILIVALWANTSLLRGFLFGGEWEAAALIFIVSSLALKAMIPPAETPDASKGESTLRARMRLLPDWSVVVYCVVTGLTSTWSCAFLWFSRRYALFSAPLVGVSGALLGFYGVIGLVVAWLIRGNWRTVLWVFLLESWGISLIALRLHLVR
jgi:hypothetical protein